MLKPLIFMGMIVLIALCVGIYTIEQQVETYRSELIGLNKQLREDKERSHILQAEWSYLTHPDRIKHMAETHLGMTTLATSQVRDIDVVPVRPVMVSSNLAQ